MHRNAWRIARGAVVFAGIVAVLATRTFVTFEAFRAKIVQAPVAPVANAVRIDVADSLRRELTPPYAVIARLENDLASPQSFTVTIDGERTCRQTFAAGPHRLDCGARAAWGTGDVHTMTITGESSSWRLQSLELATHFGGTLRHDLLIVPPGSTRYAAPGRGVILLIAVVLLVALVGPATDASRTLLLLHRMVASAAALLVCAVIASPYVSRYLILLSVPAVVLLMTLLLLPRICNLALALCSRNARPRLRTSGAAGLITFLLFACVVRDSVVTIHGGNYSGFLQISSDTFRRHPALSRREDVRASLRFAEGGYDGQFMYYETFDPFARQFRDNVAAYAEFLDTPAYRFGRIGFPLMVRILAGNSWRLYPRVMIWLVVASLAVTSVLIAAMAMANGGGAYWGLVVIAVPGFWQSVQAGLPEPVAGAFLVAGYAALAAGWFAAAGLALGASLLVRETGAVFVLAVVAALWMARERRKAVLVGALALAPVALWRLYVGVTFQSLAGFGAFFSGGQNTGLPLAGMFEVWARVSHGAYWGGATNFARSAVFFSVLVMLGLGVAVKAVAARRNAVTVAAVIYGLLAVSLSYGHVWVHVGNAERASYELFVALALVAVTTPSRDVRRLCAAFWLTAAVYVVAGAYDAEYIRDTLVAAVSSRPLAAAAAAVVGWAILSTRDRRLAVRRIVM